MSSREQNLGEQTFSGILGYEAAFYCLPDPVCIYNHTKRRILKANDAAIARYGEVILPRLRARFG